MVRPMKFQAFRCATFAAIIFSGLLYSVVSAQANCSNRRVQQSVLFCNGWPVRRQNQRRGYMTSPASGRTSRGHPQEISWKFFSKSGHPACEARHRRGQR